MKKTVLTLTIMLAAAALVAAFSSPTTAQVTGRCDICHTMHYSQGGQVLTDWGSGGPYNNCLVNTCVGCHTGTNDGTNTTPYVLGTVAPTFGTNTLAGGNFYWVAQTGGDAKGHNVLGISGQDGNITAAEGAPGSAGGCGSTSCHGTLSPVDESFGGCEGCHLNVMHHANDGTGTKYVGASPWYRFLSGHMSGDGQGVCGIEHSGWGYGATAGGTNHNEYLGFADVVKKDAAGFYNLGGTMTAYCCGCHGNFHVQDATAVGASPWLRHPSDIVIPTTGEYASMSTSYNPNTPVARSATTMGTLGNTPSGTVAAGTDLVMCLSCHVPHGSPNDDLLRWDYAAMNAGGGSNTTGCFVCHTTKDD